MYILVELERYNKFSEILAYESAKMHSLFIRTFLIYSRHILSGALGVTNMF